MKEMHEMKDLVVLCADLTQETVLKQLIQHRRKSLGIRNVTPFFIRGLSDGEVYKNAHERKMLGSHLNEYVHALVVLDCAFDKPDPYESETLRLTILNNLHESGWPVDRCEVIAIHPELEVWLWSESPKVAQYLRMNSMKEIKTLAIAKGWWINDAKKPHKPKELLQYIRRMKGIPISSGVATQLLVEDKMSFEGCEDAAFQLLRATLKRWFPEPI